jgi:histidinol-phosphate aminotransferase
MPADLDDFPALRIHGGVAPEELAKAGVDDDLVVDFSSSVNPYGPCPAVVEAIRAAKVDRYPDATASALRRAIATAFDTAPDRVVVGNGAADLLWTLARVVVRPEMPVVVAEPTFAEFRAAAQFAGARVVEHRASPDAGFAIDLDAVGRLVSASGARVVYVCSPGTPTGSHVSVDRVADFARRRDDVTIVLDQAFLSLSEHAAEMRRPVPPNVVRVRSLTKDHALAGIRLGYLLAETKLAGRIEAARPPWTTSSVAQAAGLAALENDDFVETSRAKLLADRDELTHGLAKLGLDPVPSSACFFVFPSRDAAALRARLLRKRIVVRDCSSFGMPGFIRLAARPRADRERLLGALREELA